MSRPIGGQSVQNQRGAPVPAPGLLAQPAPSVNRRATRIAVELNEHDAESLRGLQHCINQASPGTLQDVLRVFQSLKNAQKSIEASVSLNGRLGQTSPLSEPVQVFMKRFSHALAEGRIRMDQLPLHQLEVICLGLTACMGLGQPNLLSLHGAPNSECAKSLAIIVDETGKCLQWLGLKVLADEAGRTLNVHNMVTRILKAELLPARASMREISRLSLRAMLEWSKAPDLSLLVSPHEDQQFEQLRRLKRWGKSCVQLDAFIEREWALLDLKPDSDDGPKNRKSVAQLVRWLYSEPAMSQLFYDRGSAPVVLSSLVHLMGSLILAGDMPRGSDTEAIVVRLLEAMVTVMGQPGMERQIRPVMNFTSFLDDLLAWRAQSWTAVGRDGLARACAACLPMLSRLCAPGHHLEMSDAILVLGFLHALHAWCSRHAQEPGQGRSGAINATTTTSATATAITSTSALSDTPAARIALAWDSLRNTDWRGLIQGVLTRLPASALATCGRRDALTGVLEELVWLRQSTLLAADEVDALISAVLNGLAASRGPWKDRAISSVLKNIIELLEWDLVPSGSEQALLVAMLGRPPQGRQWSLPQLRSRLAGFKLSKPPVPAKGGRPAPAPAQAPRLDPWKGTIVGMSAPVPEPRLVPRNDWLPLPDAPAATNPEPATQSGALDHPAAQSRHTPQAPSTAPMQAAPSAAQSAKPASPEDSSEEDDKPARSTPPAPEAGARRRGQGKRRAGGRGRNHGKGKGKALHSVVTLPNTEKELEAARKATSGKAATAAVSAYEASKVHRKFLEATAKLAGGVDGKPQTVSIALDRKDANAQYLLGMVLLEGQAQMRDAQKALAQLTAAARQGHAEAQVQVGLLHLRGTAGAANAELAFKWFELAASQGDSSALHYVGLCHFKGLGVPMDEAKAMHWFNKAAQQGYTDAQYYLGSCHEFGHGTGEVNIVEALRWYRLAAASGDAASQSAIAGLYVEDLVEGGTPAQAWSWAKQAADQGNSDGQFRLAQCLLNGWGVSADRAKGLESMRLAADNHSPRAEYWLAQEYLKGGETRWPAGLALLERAIASGHVEALYLLGLLHCMGRGVTKNEAKGERMIRQAAEQGSSQAAEHLAKQTGQQ